jgi:hypothetical protein
VTVGYFPLVHTATAVHADEIGIFADQDLDVTLEQTAGGAQAIPSLIAGEYDITYGNYTSAPLAAQQGLPIRIIAGNDVGADDHSIMVAPDSPYQSAADLAGARIAVNNLQNIGTVAVDAVLEDAGVDISTIDFVELPYPEMAPALLGGDVDEIWQVEPFHASATAAGARVLFPPFSGPVEGMPVAGWLTTEQYAGEPRGGRGVRRGHGAGHGGPRGGAAGVGRGGRPAAAAGDGRPDAPVRDHQRGVRRLDDPGGVAHPGAQNGPPWGRPPPGPGGAPARGRHPGVLARSLAHRSRRPAHRTSRVEVGVSVVRRASSSAS